MTHRTRVWVVAPPRPFPLKVPQVPPIRTPYLLPITPTSSPDPIPDFSLRNSPLSFSETSPQPKVHLCFAPAPKSPVAQSCQGLLREGRGKRKRALGVGESEQSEGGLCKPKLEIPPPGTGDPLVLRPVVPPTLVHSHPGDSAQEKPNRGHGDPDRAGMLWAPCVSSNHKHKHTHTQTHTHTYTHTLSLSLRAVPEQNQSWVLGRRSQWLLPASSHLLPPLHQRGPFPTPPPSVERAEPPFVSRDPLSSTIPQRTSDPGT